jgi:hypothetical protein
LENEMKEDLASLGEQLLTRLDKLSDWMLEQGSTVFEIYVSRVYVEGVMDLSLAAMSVVALAVGGFLTIHGIQALKFNSEAMPENPTWLDNCKNAMYRTDTEAIFIAPGIICTLIASFSVPINLYNGVLLLATPEYTALHRLLQDIIH